MTTTHGHVARPGDITVHEIFIARQDGGQLEKFIILTLEEIETISSEATPTNTKGATACGAFNL